MMNMLEDGPLSAYFRFDRFEFLACLGPSSLRSQFAIPPQVLTDSIDPLIGDARRSNRGYVRRGSRS